MWSVSAQFWIAVEILLGSGAEFAAGSRLSIPRHAVAFGRRRLNHQLLRFNLSRCAKCITRCNFSLRPRSRREWRNLLFLLRGESALQFSINCAEHDWPFRQLIPVEFPSL